MKKGICLAAALALASSIYIGKTEAAGRNDRAEQEAQFRAQQQEARRAQEQQLRAQEEEARRVQAEQRRAQQEQTQRAEAEQRHVQEQEARQAQAEQRKEQEQQARQIQAEQRQQREQQARQIQAQQQEREQQARFNAEQHRQQEAQQRQLQAEQRQVQEQTAREAAATRHMEEVQQGAQNRELAKERNAMRHPQSIGMPPMAVPHFVRPTTITPLNITPVPLQKAVSVPMFDQALISAEEREHANQLLLNLQQHLMPVPLAQAPLNYEIWPQQNLDYYLNNYQTNFNGQPLYITRENTFVNQLPVSQYPYWYQPEPGWVYSNGFSLGNLIKVGLDWLGFGWHPYYGPQPGGFICAANYVPTPWIYYPATGLWRMAGVDGWAQSGPPYDYVGPISVEVVEPRRVEVRDPFTGWRHSRYINVTYLYNAFYYPQYDRWGYMNRNRYFLWLNTN